MQDCTYSRAARCLEGKGELLCNACLSCHQNDSVVDHFPRCKPSIFGVLTLHTATGPFNKNMMMILITIRYILYIYNIYILPYTHSGVLLLDSGIQSVKVPQ